MSLTIRKAGLPALLSDWFNTEFFGPDLTDVDFFDGKRIGVTVPSANVTETANNFLVELAAPGLKRDDFKVEMDDHTLTISAEKEDKVDEEKEGYSRKEYAYNSFCRSFTLPENVREDKVDAKYEDGVLKLVIPKREVAPKKERKKITVG